MFDKKIYYNLKYDPRPHQIDALNFVKHNIRRGKKYMLINSPTGTGKSYFAVMFMNWYLNYINSDARFDIITNSKILQNQYVKEYPFIKSLKGKNSYTCKTYNCTCQEGKEMNKALKRSCNNCPYDNAYKDWTLSDVALTNFHLFDSLHLFVPGHLENKKSNVLIVDEADGFESVLCDYISMKISERSLKLLGFNEVKMVRIFNEIKKVKSIEKYIEFLNDFFIGEMTFLLDKFTETIGNNRISNDEKIRVVKNITNLQNAILSYKNFISSIENGTDNLNNWVIDIETETDEIKKKIFPTNYTIQPVWSKKYLNDIIFKHYDHIILMSGTILDKDIFSYLNGLENNLSAYYSIDSPFPAKNRPIYFIKGVGKMTFNDKKETFENQKNMVSKIIKKHDKDKGIIHTSNYEISNWLKEVYENDNRFIFHTSDNRDEMLEKHITTTRPTILVSPSMMSGVDLKDDLSRFQIIMKVPYPNISSNKIKKRQKEYSEWYNWRTVADIIQMYGRSIRSEDDSAKTYILDDSFSNILKFNYNLLPNWFTEAIKILK